MASVEETSDVQPVNFERSSTLLFTNTPGVQFLYLGRQCCICFTNCTPTFSIPLDSRWPGEDLGEEEKLSTIKSKHIRWGQVLWYTYSGVDQVAAEQARAEVPPLPQDSTVVATAHLNLNLHSPSCFSYTSEETGKSQSCCLVTTLMLTLHSGQQDNRSF